MQHIAKANRCYNNSVTENITFPSFLFYDIAEQETARKRRFLFAKFFTRPTVGNLWKEWGTVTGCYFSQNRKISDFRDSKLFPVKTFENWLKLDNFREVQQNGRTYAAVTAFFFVL